MTNKTRHHAETEAPIEVDATASAEATAASEAGTAETGSGEAFAVLTKLQEENAELKDRLLRSLADLENLRRRSEREVNDTRVYAIAKFAGDILGVADNLSRALASVPADAADSATKAIVEGVELTEKEMLRTLEKHGVKKLDPKGERFDPNFHQAMFEIPDPSLPHGTVAEVVQVGYSIGSRVLRPAMVGVTRGGPKISASEAEKQA